MLLGDQVTGLCQIRVASPTEGQNGEHCTALHCTALHCAPGVWGCSVGSVEGSVSEGEVALWVAREPEVSHQASSEMSQLCLETNFLLKVRVSCDL